MAFASFRLSATLNKACAGHMEDEVLMREYVKVPLMPLFDIQEEITEAVQITPLKPVQNRTAEQSVDVPVPQLHGDIVEVIQLAPPEQFSEVTAVRSVGVAMTHTGSVKKWFKGKGFRFTTLDDGSDDVFIHCKQLVDTEGL